ncbi:unnamed protein product [Soboliphyme baturini]|uniref:Solute carrier family 25 member 40 n=1 Tax=Soboliphyme baturini TaxID=241478 RepID=A0A183IFM3_9BILA|nr:unnamed protein product [Soboliphyme baturini]
MNAWEICWVFLPILSLLADAFDGNVRFENAWLTFDILVTPFDVVKVRLQMQNHVILPGRCFIYNNGLMEHICTCTVREHVGIPRFQVYKPGHFSGTLDAFVKITRNEGVFSLWRGLPPTLLMAAPATVCYYTLYDNFNHFLKEQIGPRIWTPFVAGSSARIVSVTLISPLEMIRTNLQSSKSYSDIVRELRHLIRREGFKSLWLGLGPSLLRDVPFSALYWMNFELLKQKALTVLNRKETNFFISFVSGAVCGSISALVTCPFDVVKTRRQVEIAEKNMTHGNTAQVTSTWLFMLKLYRENGMRALFAGVIPRLCKVTPACAIMIGTYDYCKLLFTKSNQAWTACATCLEST